MSEANEKKKIIVLGGGMAGLTAVFHLTNAPGWSDRYDITVYESSFRLGGKGASGRNPEVFDRIEEHGLHIFLGFYNNAFAMMQQCYQELGRARDAPLATWEEAFKKHSHFVLQEDLGETKVPWAFPLGENSAVPGQGDELLTPWEYVQTLLDSLVNILEQQIGLPQGMPRIRSQQQDLGATIWSRLSALLPKGEPADGLLSDFFSSALELKQDAYLHLARDLASFFPDADATMDSYRHGVICWLLRRAISWLGDLIEDSPASAASFRRPFVLLDLGAAAVIGMIEDGLICGSGDWFKIDDVSLRGWLRSHGASERSVESPVLKILNQLVFSTEDEIAAGTALHYTLRFAFTYKGAIAYKMQAGMGDTVFAPLYTILSRRGVKFEFFHRTDALELSPDKKRIERVRIGRMVNLTSGSYQPLYDVKGLPCWPSRPLYDQIVEGKELSEGHVDLEDYWTGWADRASPLVLSAGKDFDVVVLGVSIGAFPFICKELIEDKDNPRFARMVEKVETFQTQSMQLWFTPDLAALGWRGPSPILGTNWEPFNTWADMSQLIPHESWPLELPVGNISYMCARMPDRESRFPPRADHDYPVRQEARVKEDVIAWLTNYPRSIFPGATTTHDPNELNWDWLVDRSAGQGRSRLDAQYWRAPKGPSDRYVGSARSTVRYRLRTDESGYDNLRLAGDWTLTALSAGCVEAAVMSGMEASRSISGHPEKISGDWLPPLGKSPLFPLPDRPPPVTRTALPSYIEHDGNETPLAPYTADEVALQAFLLAADYQKLMATCDRYLNLGGPTVYRPLGPFVFYVAASMKKMHPVSPRAFLTEQDFGFWMPVLAGRMDGVAFRAQRVLMFLPYLWVDSYLPSQAGREVYGFPKGVGTLRMPRQPTDPGSVTIDGLVVPRYGAPGDPEAAWQERRIVEARRTGGGLLGQLEVRFDDLRAAFPALLDQLKSLPGIGSIPIPTWALLDALLENAAKLRVPMVFLKQFRDVSDGERACYQAIVEAPAFAKGPIRAGFLEGDWEVAIQQYDSCRVLDHLGIAANSGGVACSLLNLHVEFSFTMERGQVVFQRP